MQAVASTPTTPTSTGATTVAQAPLENPKDAQAEVRKIALFLIEKEPNKPIGYRLIRSLRWDIIEKAPPSENGKTRMEPPNKEKREFLQNLMAKGEWKKALLTSQKTFCSGPLHYWLDLQRISATSCKELGNEYSSIYNTICLETALLIKRVPEIVDLSYSDGSPFCDGATKDWLESDSSSVLSSSDSSSSKKSDETSYPLKEEKKEVNALIATGKLDSAIELIQNKISDSGIERLNFKRSLILCNLLISGKHANVAMAILESLNDKITTYNLEKWEPDLAVEVWSLLIKVYKIVGNNKPQNIQIIIQEKQNSILNKISCINPKSAIEFKL